MHRLICAFVVRIWHKQVFSWHGSYSIVRIRLYENPICFIWKKHFSLSLLKNVPNFQCRDSTLCQKTICENIEDIWFLAHLSRRLTRWTYSIAMVSRPSIVVVVVHTFKLEYLWSQMANLDQILCVASLGWGKGCIRFWGRLDQNSGFHGNRKPPLTYNGENNVSTFSRLFLIRSFLYLQVTRTGIKSRTSSNFGQFGPPTTELAALERRKNFP